jgi:hypothetical protein
VSQQSIRRPLDERDFDNGETETNVPKNGGPSPAAFTALILM